MLPPHSRSGFALAFAAARCAQHANLTLQLTRQDRALASSLRQHFRSSQLVLLKNPLHFAALVPLVQAKTRHLHGNF